MATIDCAFPSGNVIIGADTFVDAGGDVYARPGNTTHDAKWWWYWFAVRRASGDAAQPSVYLHRADLSNPINATSIANVAWGWWSYTRDDPDSYQQFDNQALTATHIRLWNNTPWTAGADVYVAMHPPYPISRLTARMAEWTQSPLVSPLPSTGADFIYHTSAQVTGWDGRTIPPVPHYGFRISRAGMIGPRKRRAVMWGGTHAAETPATITLEGQVDFLLTSDPVAVRLTEAFDWDVYPVWDGPARYGGYSRPSPWSPAVDNNSNWGTGSTNPSNLALQAAFDLDVGSGADDGADLVIDHHGFRTISGHHLGWHDFSPYGKYGENGMDAWAVSRPWAARFKAMDPNLLEITVAGGATATYGFAVGRFQRGGNLALAVVFEEGSGRAYDTAEAYRLRGRRDLIVLDSLVTDGYFGATTTEPPPTSEVVYDLRRRTASGSTYTNFSPQSDLSEFISTAGLANGTYVLEGRARDTSDQAATDWESLPFTVQHAVVEPPPDPPPPDAWLAINGVQYAMLAAGIEELEPQLAGGEVVPSWDGTDLLSTADGEIRGWRIPLANIAGATHTTFRTRIARQKRCTLGGKIFGADLAGGFAATVELEGDGYALMPGYTHSREPAIVVWQVDRG